MSSGTIVGSDGRSWRLSRSFERFSLSVSSLLDWIPTSTPSVERSKVQDPGPSIGRIVELLCRPGKSGLRESYISRLDAPESFARVYATASVQTPSPLNLLSPPPCESPIRFIHIRCNILCCYIVIVAVVINFISTSSRPSTPAKPSTNSERGPRTFTHQNCKRICKLSKSHMTIF